MKNIQKKIEVASNIAIILVAFMFGGFLISRFVTKAVPQPAMATGKKIVKGTEINLPNADWNKSEKTLVLAISTKCHFCSESSPFYQKLAELKKENSGVRLIVVAPQSVEETRRYLDEHNISVDEIKQVSLDKVFVNGTPTLIMVNQKGAVVESWIGKLPAEKETEVIKSLFG